MSFRLVGKWFFIGAGVRLSLAVIVTILIKQDLEASMLYFVDVPTIFCLDVVRKLVSADLASTMTGSHPYYVWLNVLGSVLWGILFATIALIVRVIVTLRKRVA